MDGFSDYRHAEEQRPVDESGGGVSEGFELAEQELINHATHSDDGGTEWILRHAGREEPEMSDAVYGEADDVLHDWD